MPKVYVSIGSNLEREISVPRGVALLREAWGTLQLSRVYESAAVGFEGDAFYNLVAGFETADSPRAVAQRLRAMEIACGRDHNSRRFAPRTLDLDLILYGNLVERCEHYRLPREELLRYAFMLGPMAELAPHECHPVNGLDYAALWAAFDQHESALRPVDLALPEPA